jgi:hypothetical protein
MKMGIYSNMLRYFKMLLAWIITIVLYIMITIAICIAMLIKTTCKILALGSPLFLICVLAFLIINILKVGTNIFIISFLEYVIVLFTNIESPILNEATRYSYALSLVSLIMPTVLFLLVGTRFVSEGLCLFKSFFVRIFMEIYSFFETISMCIDMPIKAWIDINREVRMKK